MKEEIYNYLKDVKMPESIKEPTMKYCTKCEKVWENVYRPGYNSSLEYYPGLPSYGLKKESCKGCEVSE